MSLHLIEATPAGAGIFRTYRRDRRGVVETLTIGSVVYVRPCWGMLKPAADRKPSRAAKRKTRSRSKGRAA